MFQRLNFCFNYDAKVYIIYETTNIFMKKLQFLTNYG